MMDKLIEAIESIKHRCEIIETLWSVKKTHLIPTVVEDMYDAIHLVLDKYCIEKDES